MPQINDVNDHGLETLKKSAIIPDDTYKTRYAHRVQPIDANNRALQTDSNGNLKTIDERFTFDNNGNLNAVDERFTFDGNDNLNVIDDRLTFDGSNNLNVIDDRFEFNNDGQLKVVLDGKVDPNNTSKNLLLANATFTGTATDTINYAIIFVNVYSNVASAINGLKVQVSSDATNWRTGEQFSIQAGSEKTFSFQPSRRYFRVVYTNGATNQTTFDLEVLLKKNNSKPSSHRIQDEIVNDDDAELVKAVLTGEKPNGTFTNFSATNGGNFKVSLEELESGISTNSNTQLKVTPYTSTGKEIGTAINPINVDLPGYIDTFNRIRVSEPFTRFDFTFQYDERPQIFTSLTASGGTLTYDSNKKAVILNVTTTTNSEVVYQTRQYFKYFPGKSNLLVFTGNFKSAATNVVKQYGQFDANNGYFFELNGSTPYVVLRSSITGSVVDTKIAQASWNIDKLNGTGSSGFTLDWSKQQIFVINYQWLGAGKVFYGFDIDGKIYWCHSISNANVLTTLYSQTAQLPIRAAIKNTSATASTMEMTCGAIISEGGSSPLGRKYTVNSGSTPRSFVAIGTRIPVLSIRKKLANLPTEIQLINMFGLFSVNDEFLVEIVKNGTLTNASFADVAGHLQRDVAATAITGGDTIFSNYARGDLVTSILGEYDDSTNFFLGQLLDGTSETISIVATNLTASANAYVAINYKEVF